MDADRKRLWISGQFIEVSEEVYAVYMQGDRKMRYFENDLKTERTVLDKEGRVVKVIPSREDSLDRLAEDQAAQIEKSFGIMCASPSLNGKESEGLFFWPPCSLKIEYPFIRHIPIAIVMSISHMSCCATIYQMIFLRKMRGISETHLSVQTIRTCKKVFTKQQSIWKRFSEICFWARKMSFIIETFI